MVTALTVFLTVWGLDLLLFAIPWMRYTGTSTEAWIAVYGSILTFTAGCLIATRLASPVHSEDSEELDSVRLRRLWLACFLLGLVGFADFVHAVDIVIGWRAIFEHTALVRDLETTSQKFKATYGVLKLLTYLGLPAFLLWSVGLRSKFFRGRWLVAGAFGWVSLVPFLLTADRSLTFTALIWALCFHLVWRPVRRPARLVPSVVTILVGLVLIFSLLGSRVSKTIDDHPEIKQQLTTQTLSSLALPYVYVTANPPTLSQLMRDPIRPHTDGRMTFLPVIKLLHAAGIGGTPPEQVGAFYPIPFETFNNYSWLGSFYLDFGLVGCLILPALIGFLVTLVVLSAVRRRHLLNMWFASLGLYVVFFSPLLNKLSTTLTWEYALLGPVAAVLLRRNPSPRQWLAGARNHISSLPRPALAGATIVLVAFAGFAVVRRIERAPVRLDAGTLSRELAISMQKASLARQSELFPSSRALVSRLHVSDPALDFIPLGDSAQAPAESGVIGVYSTGSALSLSVRGSLGITQLHSPAPQPPRGSLGSGGNLVKSSYFNADLGRIWHSTSNGVGKISVTRKPTWRGHASLMLRGTGKAAVGSTFVEQSLDALPSASSGTVYDFGFVALRHHLSRTVEAWIKLYYVDGSYEPVLAHPLHGRLSASGIPAGSDRGWQAYGAEARAVKPLLAVELFICDTGSGPLTGTVQISDVSLVLRLPGAPAFSDIASLLAGPRV